MIITVLILSMLPSSNSSIHPSCPPPPTHLLFCSLIKLIFIIFLLLFLLSVCMRAPFNNSRSFLRPVFVIFVSGEEPYVFLVVEVSCTCGLYCLYDIYIYIYGGVVYLSVGAVSLTSHTLHPPHLHLFTRRDVIINKNIQQCVFTLLSPRPQIRR